MDAHWWWLAGAIVLAIAELVVPGALRASGVPPPPSASRASSPMPPKVPIRLVASTGNRIVLALGEVANWPIASTYFCAMK